MPDIYSTLKDFQGIIGTVITGIVGFTGVILTLRRNAQNAANVRLATLAHDIATTRLMLCSELTVMERSLKAWREVLESSPGAIPRSFGADGLCRAYRAALPKLGLLTETEIQQAVLAYSEYEALSKMSFDAERDVGHLTGIMRVENFQVYQAYVQALRSTHAAVEEALRVLVNAHKRG